MREERAAKLRVERELQRAKDRRVLDDFRKSYAARAEKAFQERREAGREDAAPPPPLGLGNFISYEPSTMPICQALKRNVLRLLRRKKPPSSFLPLKSVAG